MLKADMLRFFETYQSVQAASLAALKVDIAKGMQDVQSGRVGSADMAVIKAEGRFVLAKKHAKT